MRIIYILVSLASCIRQKARKYISLTSPDFPSLPVSPPVAYSVVAPVYSSLGTSALSPLTTASALSSVSNTLSGSSGNSVSGSSVSSSGSGGLNLFFDLPSYSGTSQVATSTYTYSAVTTTPSPFQPWKPSGNIVVPGISLGMQISGYQPLSGGVSGMALAALGTSAVTPSLMTMSIPTFAP